MNKIELAVQNESFVLGCILHDQTLMDEISLGNDHFINLHNRELFKVMLQLSENGKDINLYSIIQLGESVLRLTGGTQHITKLMNSVPSVHDFHTYQQAVKEYHVVAKAQSIVNEFIENTTETNDVKKLETMIKQVSDLEASTVKSSATIKDLLSERMLYHSNSPTSGISGVDTGFTSLNRWMDGWQPSDLIIVGARPSMGKTALVLNSLLKGCEKNDIFGTFFSIEMAKGQIIDRLLAMAGGINLQKMRNPNKTFGDKEWEKYHKATAYVDHLNLDIRDEFTVPEIRSAIRKNMKENPGKKHVVAIDFLTLVKPVIATGNTHVDMTSIIQDLKQITKDFNIPMIVLAQLNRGVEQRQDKRPVMSDIRESGSIEQIADVITFLYRDDYYNPESEAAGITEIIFAKNRNGSTGTIKLKFQKETNTFYDLVMS